MKRWIWSLLLAMAALAGSGTHAYALTLYNEERLIVPKGEVHEGDIAVFNRSVEIDGTVKGDVYAFTERLNIRGTVEGDVISVARNAVITGRVDGDVRTFSERLSIDGDVNGNVTAFVHLLAVERGGRVSGSLLGIVQNLDVMGRVDGEANGMVRQLRIGGTLGGGTSHLLTERLEAQSTAVIGGDLVYRSPNRAVISPGAALKGQEHYTPYVDRHIEEADSIFRWGTIASLASTMLLWLLIRYLLSPAYRSIHVTLDDRRWTHLGKGAVCLIAAFLASLLLLLTVIGIPVSLVLALTLIVLLCVAKIFVGSWAGSWLSRRSGWRIAPLLAEGIGVIGLWAAIQLPGIGWLVALAVWSLFLGALLDRARPTM